MEKQTAIGILKTFNRWRRGEDVEPQLNPSDIGKAIDVAIEVMEEPTPETVLQAAREVALRWWKSNIKGNDWTTLERMAYFQGHEVIAQWITENYELTKKK